MSNELTLQEAALAWAQGKRVEAIGPSNAWGLIQEVGSSGGMWQPGVFSGDSSRVFRFRLAPEPPAKKWRSWTPEEVPIGALIRFAPVVTSHCWMITGWNLASFFTSNSAMGPVRFEEAEGKGCQHSIDNGKTWLPCGVEVES